MFKVIAGMLVLPIPVVTQACPITHYVDCRYMLLVVILYLYIGKRRITALAENSRYVVNRLYKCRLCMLH